MAVNKHGNDIPCMYFVNSRVSLRKFATTRLCRCEILQRHTLTLSHALEHAIARFCNGMLHHQKGSPQAKIEKGVFG